MLPMTIIKHKLAQLVHEDEGAQVVEYALVIALVSIGLAVALKDAIANPGFSTFVEHVTNCLSGGSCP